MCARSFFTHTHVCDVQLFINGRDFLPSWQLLLQLMPILLGS